LYGLLEVSKGEASTEEAFRKHLERVTVSADRVEIITIGDTVPNADEAPERRTIVVQAKLAHRNGPESQTTVQLGPIQF
jgi:hypothetical protein